MKIGPQIKTLRKSKKMTLVELSEKSGVQIATLSRIENGKMIGTLESHMNIAKALGVDITLLYQRSIGPPKPPVIETQNSVAEEFKHNEKSGYEILTKKVLNKKMMPILIRLDPQGETPIEQGVAESEKFLYVLEGSVEITINNQSYKLDKGHTLYFDASLSHQMRNKAAKAARVICVGTPVML